MWQNVEMVVETSREARKAGFARFWSALVSENVRFVRKSALVDAIAAAIDAVGIIDMVSDVVGVTYDLHSRLVVAVFWRCC